MGKGRKNGGADRTVLLLFVLGAAGRVHPRRVAPTLRRAAPRQLRGRRTANTPTASDPTRVTGRCSCWGRGLHGQQ
ncbi:hypothetical protein FMEAI12_2550010 [Parafrankia sp. Ea1.12]|nr:hypothetical protein FMEAI12_2550010 [Parafrankia sp. Ea1.12]